MENIKFLSLSFPAIFISPTWLTPNNSQMVNFKNKILNLKILFVPLINAFFCKFFQKIVYFPQYLEPFCLHLKFEFSPSAVFEKTQFCYQEISIFNFSSIIIGKYFNYFLKIFLHRNFWSSRAIHKIIQFWVPMLLLLYLYFLSYVFGGQ